MSAPALETSAPALPRPGPLVSTAALVALCAIWGSTWVVIQGGLDRLPPFGSAAARFTLAALISTAVAPWLARREGGAQPSAALSLVVGGLNFGVSYGVLYWAETRLPSGLVSVLFAVYPLMQAVLGHFVLEGERVRRVQALGFVVGLGGVCSLFATDLARLGPEAIGAAAVLMVSPLVTALSVTYTKRRGGAVSSALLSRNALWVGSAVLWVAALVSERGAPVDLDGGAVASVVYLAVVSVIAFGLYFWLLRYTAANRLTVIPYVTPGIALMMGAVFRGEPITPTALLGLGGILAGVFLMSRRAGA